MTSKKPSVDLVCANFLRTPTPRHDIQASYTSTTEILWTQQPVIISSVAAKDKTPNSSKTKHIYNTVSILKWDWVGGFSNK